MKVSIQRYNEIRPYTETLTRSVNLGYEYLLSFSYCIYQAKANDNIAHKLNCANLLHALLVQMKCDYSIKRSYGAAEGIFF